MRSFGEPIPGCTGSGGHKTWDYCYDPKERSRDVDFGPAKMTPTECMRAVRRNSLCDHTYFNLGADGKCSCVGTTTDCSAKKYQRKENGTVYKIVLGQREREFCYFCFDCACLCVHVYLSNSNLS